MKIVVASHNKGKIREIEEMFKSRFDNKYEVVSAGDYGIDVGSIDETEDTFEGNSMIKAKAVRDELVNKNVEEDFIVLADDSGLEVKDLNNEPGIHTARYLGENATQKEKNESIIDRVNKIEGASRDCRFVCVVTLIKKDGTAIQRKAYVYGKISDKEKGTNGHGYDPIVYVKEYDATLAEITTEEKNKISHRGNAIKAIFEVLEEGF